MSTVSYQLKRFDGLISAYQRETQTTQTQLAKVLQMRPATLISKRKGRTNFTAPELFQLCDLMGVSVDETAFADWRAIKATEEAADDD